LEGIETGSRPLLYSPPFLLVWTDLELEWPPFLNTFDRYFQVKSGLLIKERTGVCHKIFRKAALLYPFYEKKCIIRRKLEQFHARKSPL